MEKSEKIIVDMDHETAKIKSDDDAIAPKRTIVIKTDENATKSKENHEISSSTDLLKKEVGEKLQKGSLLAKDCDSDEMIRKFINLCTGEI